MNNAKIFLNLQLETECMKWSYRQASPCMRIYVQAFMSDRNISNGSKEVRPSTVLLISRRQVMSCHVQSGIDLHFT